MATFALTDVHVYLDHYDLTCYLPELQLVMEAEALDETTFCDDNRTFKAGLLHNTLSYKGFLDTAEINASTDDSIEQLHFSRVSLETPLITIAPNGGAAGDIAYFGEWNLASYSPAGEVGQLIQFDVAAEMRGKLSRGQLMRAVATAVTGDTTTSKYQLGAVPAGSRLVAIVHCTEFDGTSLDIDVRSDANAGAGGETVRGSFTQLTDVGSERIVIAAPITDTYWDVDITFVGTSAKVAIALAIQTYP